MTSAGKPMRLLSTVCLLGVTLPGAARAADDACRLDKALYENLQDPQIIIGSEAKPQEPESTAPYIFFDESLRRLDPKRGEKAPAYLFRGHLTGIPTAFYRLKSCLTPGVSIPTIKLRQSPPSLSCPFRDAIYENLEDSSVSMWSEPFPLDSVPDNVRLVIEGKNTPKRSYHFSFQNGTGYPYVQYRPDTSEDWPISLFYAFNEKLSWIGPDPAPKFILVPGFDPATMFRLKECRAKSTPAR